MNFICLFDIKTRRGKSCDGVEKGNLREISVKFPQRQMERDLSWCSSKL